MLYKAVALTLSIVMCLFVVACDDDDANEDIITDETVEYTAAQIDSIGYDILLDVVAPYDTTEAVPQRVVQWARCLFPAYADEYYCQAESYEEAKQYFLNVIVPACLQDKVQTMGDGLTLSVLDATITFQSASGNGKVAEIDFDLPQVDVIKKAFFIQSTAWPTNEDIFTPFQRGEICRDAYGRYYVCARPSTYATGILVSVDDLYLEWFSRHTYWQGGMPFSLPTHNADPAAFESLRRYAEYCQEDFAAQINKFKAVCTDQSAQELMTFLSDICEQREANYIMGPVSFAIRLYFFHYYYIFSFSYYQCSDMSIQDYKTLKRTEIPTNFLGTRQLYFNTDMDVRGWTKVVAID